MQIFPLTTFTEELYEMFSNAENIPLDDIVKVMNEHAIVVGSHREIRFIIFRDLLIRMLKLSAASSFSYQTSSLFIGHVAKVFQLASSCKVAEYDPLSSVLPAIQDLTDSITNDVKTVYYIFQPLHCIGSSFFVFLCLDSRTSRETRSKT
jgi:hypothetical protein